MLYAPNILSHTALDTVAVTWVSNVKANGGDCTPEEIRAVSNFVKFLRPNGTWDAIRDCAVFLGTDMKAAQVKLKTYTGNYIMSVTGTPQYTQSLGLFASGSWGSGSLNIGINFRNWATGTGTVNNAHFSMMCSRGWDYRPFGCSRVWVYQRHYLVYNFDGNGKYCWGNNSTYASTVSGSRIVTKGSANPVYLYVNGVYVNSYTGAVDAAGNPADFVWEVGCAVGSEDGSTSYPQYWQLHTTKPIQFYSLGTNLTAQQAYTLHTAINTLNQQFNRGV